MTFRSGQDFETLAENLAQSIVEIMEAEAGRSRDRKVELIRHTVKRAISHGFRVGIARGSNKSAETDGPVLDSDARRRRA